VLQIHAFTGSGKVSNGKQLALQDDTVLQIHALTPRFIFTNGREYLQISMRNFRNESIQNFATWAADTSHTFTGIVLMDMRMRAGCIERRNSLVARETSQSGLLFLRKRTPARFSSRAQKSGAPFGGDKARAGHPK